MQATLIYPHQLFSNHPALSRSRPVYLFEEQLFFRDWHYPARFHRQKLVLHRAAMTCYQRELERRGYTVRYIEYAAGSEMPNLRAVLRTDNIHTLALADQADDLASRRLRRLASELKIRLDIHESPGFLCAEEEFRKFFADADSLRQTPFYIRQRQRLGVLMDKDRPAGGRWSYDPANREPLTTGVDIPEPPRIRETPQISAARDYVAERFGDHPGDPTASTGRSPTAWPSAGSRISASAASPASAPIRTRSPAGTSASSTR